MKLITIFGIWITLISCNQQANKTAVAKQSKDSLVTIPEKLDLTVTQPKSENLKSDTVFIQKDSLEGVSQSIFFETNKKSKYYKNLTSFEFDEFDKESYQWSLDYLKKQKISLTKQKNILPSDKWVLIQQYKGQFYAYHPCDFYNYYKVSISDTAYIEWTGEGPVANKILNKRKINNTTFEVKTTGMYEQHKIVIVHIIDGNKGIAVFEERRDDNSQFFYLMIMADKIKSVPLIVNNCEIYKQNELEFEKPDFEKLIKNK